MFLAFLWLILFAPVCFTLLNIANLTKFLADILHIDLILRHKTRLDQKCITMETTNFEINMISRFPLSIYVFAHYRFL